MARHVQQLGGQCQLPTEEVAVVLFPSVNDFYGPITVQRAANKTLERLVWFVEMGAVNYIGGSEPITYCKTPIILYGLNVVLVVNQIVVIVNCVSIRIPLISVV